MRTLLSCAVLTSTLVGWTARAAIAEGFSRPAVELKSPSVAAPVETAGTGFAPEATVRIKVDERGRVAEVDVSRIKPSTEHDPLVVRQIEETLAEWRYAPALENGVAVPVELSWTLQFVPRSIAPRRPFEIDDGRDGSAETLRARYLAMEREERERLLTEVAERMIAYVPGEPTRHETPRFLVYTDADPEAAVAIGNNLEVLYGVLSGMFANEIPLQPEPLKIVTVVYTRAASYRDMISTAQQFEWSSGYYHPAGAMAFHLEVPTNDYLLGLILHEATHAFMDRHIVAHGTSVPRWLGEGLAEYMGNSKVEKKRLIPGKTRKRKAYLTMSGGRIGSTDAWLDATHVKRAVRGKKALTLGEIFNAGPEIFYGEKRDLYYPMSWFLVHYLRHGEEGWRESNFPTFLTYVAEGFPAGPAFERAYGRSVEAMEASFRDYILRF